MCFYVDDYILVEVQLFPDGRRCLHAVMISDHCRLSQLAAFPVSHYLMCATDEATRVDGQEWLADLKDLAIVCPTPRFENSDGCGRIDH